MLPDVTNLKTILLARLETVIDSDTVDANTPLLEGGLDLDSIALMELITTIEDQYEVAFSEEDFELENFSTLAAIASLLERCMGRDADPAQ